ncbi:MAG: hypothetical protein ACYC9W_09150 [Candidatus Limnocylindria bacterium]
MGEERAPDPLTSFISRSLRALVTDVSEELVRATAEAELDRVHFTQGGARRTLIVKRVPRRGSLEVTLLPHLARKTDRVPAVHARGIPPPTVAAWPWLLIEDLLDAPEAGDLEAVVRTKAVIERAVAADGPALAALGVPRIARRGPLAEWPEVIVHGALARSHAVSTDRGVVLTEWGSASLGCGLADVVRLAQDAGVPSRPLALIYAALSGLALTDDALRCAEQR